MHVPNGIAHFDVAGPHAGALHAFYRNVFGWTIAAHGPGYASVTTPAGSPDGAITESPQPSLTIGIVVTELARSLADALAHGGTIVMPPTDNGWIVKAQITDPSGNLMTLIQG